MNKEQAIGILIQTALIAQKSGALNLNDAVVVKQAIDLLQPELSKVEATPKVKVEKTDGTNNS